LFYNEVFEKPKHSHVTTANLIIKKKEQKL